MNDITFVGLMAWMFSRSLIIITLMGLYFAIKENYARKRSK